MCGKKNLAAAKFYWLGGEKRAPKRKSYPKEYARSWKQAGTDFHFENWQLFWGAVSISTGV
jgi:hypothetical protein